MDYDIAIKLHSVDDSIEIRDSPYLCPFSVVRAMPFNMLLSYFMLYIFMKKSHKNAIPYNLFIP